MWYWFFKGLVAPAMWVLCRPRVRGRGNIPAQGGAILAVNHLAAVDTLLVPAMERRRVTFPAKAELFRRNGHWRHDFVAWFMHAIGQVPMDRSGGRASAAALEPVLAALRDGRLVGIFPEGTRSPDGRLYRGRTGVARLALLSGAPVIPVGLRHTQARSGPFGLKAIWDVEVRFGEPVRYDSYAFGDRDGDHDVLRWVTDDVMARIQQLTGQDYVDVYGSLVKHGSMSAAEAQARVLAHPHEGKSAPPEVAAP